MYVHKMEVDEHNFVAMLMISKKFDAKATV